MKKTKKTRGMQSIGEIMPVALKKFSPGQDLSKYTLIINWEKIVGREIAANAVISHIDRGTLIIKVKNSVWGHHLMMLKGEMIPKVNAYLGENIINDIWFMAGYDKDNQNYESMENAIDKNRLKPARLDRMEIETARVIAEGIKDGAIRNSFISLLLKDMAREKAKKNDNWQSCLSCEVLVPPGKKYCTVCLMNRNKKSKTGALMEILRKNPWFSYKEMREYLDSSPEEYNAAKEKLIYYYVKKIFSEKGGKIYQADLVMLLKEIKPADLTQVCIDSVIGEVENRIIKKGGEKCVFTPGG